ncbi:hypothetical protein PCANC_04716 [Puccinia coronata f. sp. avenae]|uniref:Uncharacterized protein n=1 Tax=Puccinia coronata f. sp. avenae TaxID=200324 RepID=A0A2N5SXX1_9BASI|nr:hypothetical protein PCANC_14716 [Puccinia coronata f. sp. avenae]PLW56118.1 hypothetical protein PCANC_04716 [Puccinia coronata f. sp. avenae]
MHSTTGRYSPYRLAHDDSSLAGRWEATHTDEPAVKSEAAVCTRDPLLTDLSARIEKNPAQLRIPHPARKSLLVASCHTGHRSKSGQLYVYDIPPPHSPHDAKWSGVSYTELRGAPLRAGPVLEARLSLTSVVFLAAQATP